MKAAAVGEVMVDSSDQRLLWPRKRSGGELVEIEAARESRRPVPEGVELLEERMRRGMRRLERKEVKLSLRLRMEFERLTFRGR